MICTRPAPPAETIFPAVPVLMMAPRRDTKPAPGLATMLSHSIVLVDRSNVTFASASSNDGRTSN